MLGIELLALMALIVLFAYFVKGIMGFSEGMILMSFSLLLVDIKFALPIALVIMLSGGLYGIFRLWKNVELDIMKLVLVPSIIGVFFGALILSSLDSAPEQKKPRSGRRVLPFFAVQSREAFGILFYRST